MAEELRQVDMEDVRWRERAIRRKEGLLTRDGGNERISMAVAR